MMTSLSEQRAAVKFCFLLGKNAAETVLMLKTAYKDDAKGKTQVYEWLSRFRYGDMSIDIPRSGRPSTAQIDENVEKFENSCSQTVGRQLINCQRSVEYHGAQFSEF